MSEQLNALRNRIVGHVVDEVYGGAIEDDSVVYETVDVVLKQILAVSTPAVGAVLAERRRQIEAEGFGPDHDDVYQECELLRASASYVMHTALMLADKAKDQVPGSWPWAPHWWKSTTPRRNLVKAAALIIAEIDRLDRQEARNG